MNRRSVLACAAFLALSSSGGALAKATESSNPVTYFKNPEGKFARSISMAFETLPRLGDEVRAGPNIYRVTRILHIVVDGRSTETRVYFERVGPADPD